MSETTITTRMFIAGIVIAILISSAVSTQLITGPMGLQGSQGDPGPTGATGSAGSQGPQGEKGDIGSAGSQGPQGEKGDIGSAGSQGPQGEIGPQGTSGVNIVEYIEIPAVKGIGTTVQNMGRVIIDVPSSGYVVLTITTDIVTFGDQTECWIGLGRTDSSFDLDQTYVGVLDGSGSQRRIFSATSQAVVSVLPGSHTFYVNAKKSTVWDVHEVNVGNINVIAIFYSYTH
jgi:hypothetical protein